MKVLVIYSHAYPETSKAGNAILEVFQATPSFEVRNLDELYPDLNKIDVAAEQKALVEADVIIFQHPIFWFGVPATLKRWMEVVLQHGFAFGTDGDKLHGKKFIHSVTPCVPLLTTAVWTMSRPSLSTVSSLSRTPM